MKGASFERSICKLLSLWLSKGKRDDYLWRSSQSGGRATVRQRRGKKTAGHYGDIAPTCGRGRRLTRHVAIECKTGYEACSLYNLLDHRKSNSLMMQGFIQQAKAAQKACGTKHWAIIQRRHGRDIMIISTPGFFQSLNCGDYEDAIFNPDEESNPISVMRLTTFLKHANPDRLRRTK